MLNLTHYGSAKPFTWTNKDLVRFLSEGEQPIVDDPLIINAFRQIKREDFLPESHKELAYHDRLVNIGFGEVSTNPSLVAKKLQILSPEYGKHYLHLGTGTGYLTTLLAFLAGEAGKVYSMERIQWLWDKAREFSKPYRENLNLEILYRDGSEGLPNKAPFDGIVLSYIPSEYPTELLDQLKVGGKLIFPTVTHHLETITRVDDNEFSSDKHQDFNAYAFGKHKSGKA